MAVLIDKPLVEAKIQALASMTGETIQDAIAVAMDERIAPPRKQNDPSVEEILATVRSFGLKRANDHLSEDEILATGRTATPNRWSSIRHLSSRSFARSPTNLYTSPRF